MRVWPTYTPRNRAPTALYLHQRGYGAINRVTVANLQGRQATSSGTIARVRERHIDASGTYYTESVVADAESGRGRFQTQTREAAR